MTKPKQKAPVVRVLGVQTRPDHITVQVGKDHTYTYEASPYMASKVQWLTEVRRYGRALQELKRCVLVASIDKNRYKHVLKFDPFAVRWCDLCHGAEAGLPTQCPGRKLSDGEMVGISDKVLDFRRGAWVSL